MCDSKITMFIQTVEILSSKHQPITIEIHSDITLYGDLHWRARDYRPLSEFRVTLTVRRSRGFVPFRLPTYDHQDIGIVAGQVSSVRCSLHQRELLSLKTRERANPLCGPWIHDVDFHVSGKDQFTDSPFSP